MPGQDAVSARHRSILHVDDDAAVRAALRTVLEGRFGGRIRVHEAEDGQEALLRLGVEPCDLVVTDIEMPGLDGRRLVLEMKSRKFLPGLPLIVLSSLAEDPALRQSIGTDALAYFPKPFDALALGDFIGMVLGLKPA